MDHYVTIFDADFAPQGLALYTSLVRHAEEFTLWVICVDEEVERLLHELSPPRLRTIPIEALETPLLKEVRDMRTRAEYCWTLTPFSFDAVFDRDPKAHHVTYVDADVWLASDPAPIFSAFYESGAAVQITEHAYSPEHDASGSSGKYCVQFLTMDRTRSAPVRDWWSQRCIEWCFNRVEDGKFGDQKYLDDWPRRFGELVHVAAPKERFQGPWNATRFPYSDAVTYHFHGFRLADNRRAQIGHEGYALPRPHVKGLYEPYIADIAAAIDALTGLNRTPSAQVLERIPHRSITDRVIARILRPVLRRLQPRSAPVFIDLPLPRTEDYAGKKLPRSRP